MYEAMDTAGYTTDDVTPFVYDGGDVWFFVYEDRVEGGYAVGTFAKPTATKRGDYIGEPVAEELRMVEAMDIAEKAAAERAA